MSTRRAAVELAWQAGQTRDLALPTTISGEGQASNPSNFRWASPRVSEHIDCAVLEG